MTLAIVHSRAAMGIEAPQVEVEVHLSNGLPGFSIVGLPEKVVKESKDRVRSAIINCGFKFPVKRIVVNLAPADLPKEGGRFDLPIALGILAASKQIRFDVLDQYEFAGELALTGRLLPIRGALTLAVSSKQHGRMLVMPSDNASEVALVEHEALYVAQHLNQICEHINEIELLPLLTKTSEPQTRSCPDIADVKGQSHAKRALEIAATGGHSLLFIGPPGTGKTMLASRLPGLLPSLSHEQSLETAAIYSLSTQGFLSVNWQQRPFRAPHHSASSVALVGGGSPPRPGEISLAHNGVLFLDELPEFSRHVLEGLREPIESGVVTISRAARQAQFPARFQMIAAMNPCPCGYLDDDRGRCNCTIEQVQRYQGRISGPLMDRIDMHLSVRPLPVSEIVRPGSETKESSDEVRERVTRVRHLQETRQQKLNAVLGSQELERYCEINSDDRDYLQEAITQLGLSARAYHRVLKLGRTIADVDKCERIERMHLQEALSYRRLDQRLAA